MAFEDVLEELSNEFDVDLHPDLHGLCTIMINETFKVQLEVDVTGENIQIATLVCELPPGRFRENILKDALKANYQVTENHGTLSYTGPDNALVLLLNVLMHGLTGKELYEHLSIFVQRATGWRKAIDSGFPSPQDTNEVPKGDGSGKTSLFGFKE